MEIYEPSDDTFLILEQIKDYAHGNEWYIGGMFNTTGNYTGYSGYVDDFILFDAAINDSSTF